MLTPAESVAQLEEALAAGTTTVTFSDGRSVTYNSIPDLQKAISYFKAKDRSTANKRSVGVTVGGYFRG